MSTLWLILGALAALLFYFVATKFKLAWWEWVLLVLGTILFLFSVQNYGAFRAEYETRAAMMQFWLFGLPGLILIALGFFLPFQRSKKG